MSRKRKIQRARYDYREMEKILLGTLSDRERLKIRKNFPYRVDRNRLLQRLWKQGVSQILLSKISGISDAQIFRIVHEENSK